MSKIKPYLCACGQRFGSEQEFRAHEINCGDQWLELPVDPYHPQVMTGEQRRYFVEGYERGYAAGVGAERDSLALQLQAAQDALALVIAENTANVAARDAMWPVVDEAIAWRAAIIDAIVGKTYSEYDLPVGLPDGDATLMRVIAAYIEKASPHDPPHA